jgi:hypothetical protein
MVTEISASIDPALIIVIHYTQTVKAGPSEQYFYA